MNGSFEANPAMGQDDKKFNCPGWTSVSRFSNETPPDIHPNNFWNVNLKPSDKESYLGMVARDNGSYEAVLQELSSPLQKNIWYSFAIDLAQSNNYISRSRISHSKVNYNSPMVLRVYGYDNNGNRNLLSKSDPITNEDWKNYTFFFRSNQATYFIELEVGYPNEMQEATNGHILLDHMSDITYFEEGDAFISFDSLLISDNDVVSKLEKIGYDKTINILKDHKNMISLEKNKNVVKLIQSNEEILKLQKAIIYDSESFIQDILLINENKFISDKINASTLKAIKDKKNSYLKIDFENGNIVKFSNNE